jgi:hypothetical protein
MELRPLSSWAILSIGFAFYIFPSLGDRWENPGLNHDHYHRLNPRLIIGMFDLVSKLKDVEFKFVSLNKEEWINL